MADRRVKPSSAIVRRDLLESRTSLCWTPLVMLLLIVAAMLVAVAMADHIDAVRKSVMELGPEPGGPAELRIDELNPLLQMVHNLFLLVLILVCANYLLGALFVDRRDRSVLFWKSMPVSETREVLSRFGVALVAAPCLYIAASLLAQVACVTLGMALAWRMEMDPVALVWQRVDVLQLLMNHAAGYLLMTLWLAPTYAWLLLASSAATRSPFMFALTPVLGLLLCERILLDSGTLASALGRHIPHLGGSPYAGFTWHGAGDLPALLVGLAFAGLAIAAAVYLRRYYFEL